jgi:hypothetical protein
LYIASTLVSIFASTDLFFLSYPAVAVPVTRPAALPLSPTCIDLPLVTLPPISFFEEFFLSDTVAFCLLRVGREDPREELEGDLLLYEDDLEGELDDPRDGDFEDPRDDEPDEPFVDGVDDFRFINSYI